MKNKRNFRQLLIIPLLLFSVFGVIAVTTALAADGTPQAPTADPTMPPPIIEFPGIARTDAISGTGVITGKTTLTPKTFPNTTGAAGNEGNEYAD